MPSPEKPLIQTSVVSFHLPFSQTVFRFRNISNANRLESIIIPPKRGISLDPCVLTRGIAKGVESWRVPGKWRSARLEAEKGRACRKVRAFRANKICRLTFKATPVIPSEHATKVRSVDFLTFRRARNFSDTEWNESSRINVATPCRDVPKTVLPSQTCFTMLVYAAPLLFPSTRTSLRDSLLRFPRFYSKRINLFLDLYRFISRTNYEFHQISLQ